MAITEYSFQNGMFCISDVPEVSPTTTCPMGSMCMLTSPTPASFAILGVTDVSDLPRILNHIRTLKTMNLVVNVTGPVNKLAELQRLAGQPREG